MLITRLLEKNYLYKYLAIMDFINTDTSKILEETIEAYETISGKKLYPGDPVRLLLSSTAYLETLVRNDINYTGKMNLLKYATGEYLDELGNLLGVSRLPASHAYTTLLFSLSEKVDFDVVVPKGTRVTPDGKLFFETIEEAIIVSGDISAQARAVSTVAGAAGNGFVRGQIRNFVDTVPYVESVTNISDSYGGTDVESDEHLRERIRLAPESFSNAGSKGAYIFHTKSLNQEITDVSVFSETPGNVNIVFVLKNGELPGSEIISAVEKGLTHEKIRPLTDNVNVYAPTIVNYYIDFSYYVLSEYSALSANIYKEVENVVKDFILWQKTKIGRDILPDELIARLKNIEGVYRVNITSPSYKELRMDELAYCSGQRIVYNGVVDA